MGVGTSCMSRKITAAVSMDSVQENSKAALDVDEGCAVVGKEGNVKIEKEVLESPKDDSAVQKMKKKKVQTRQEKKAHKERDRLEKEAKNAEKERLAKEKKVEKRQIKEREKQRKREEDQLERENKRGAKVQNEEQTERNRQRKREQKDVKKEEKKRMSEYKKEEKRRIKLRVEALKQQTKDKERFLTNLRRFEMYQWQQANRTKKQKAAKLEEKAKVQKKEQEERMKRKKQQEKEKAKQQKKNLTQYKREEKRRKREEQRMNKKFDRTEEADRRKKFRRVIRVENLSACVETGDNRYTVEYRKKLTFSDTLNVERSYTSINSQDFASARKSEAFNYSKERWNVREFYEVKKQQNVAEGLRWGLPVDRRNWSSKCISYYDNEFEYMVAKKMSSFDRSFSNGDLHVYYPLLFPNNGSNSSIESNMQESSKMDVRNMSEQALMQSKSSTGIDATKISSDLVLHFGSVGYLLGQVDWEDVATDVNNLMDWESIRIPETNPEVLMEACEIVDDAYV